MKYFQGVKGIFYFVHPLFKAILGEFPGGTTAEVSRDIDLKKLNFQGLFDFFLDFSRGYRRFFLNQNIKAEKVRPPPCMVIKWNSPIFSRNRPTICFLN